MALKEKPFLGKKKNYYFLLANSVAEDTASTGCLLTDS